MANAKATAPAFPIRERFTQGTGRYESHCYIVEEDPRYRTIFLYGKAYYIPTPWIYYRLDSREGLGGYLELSRIWVAGKQVASDEDYLSTPPFPNIYERGRPCYYNTGRFDHEAPAEAAITTCVTSWWGSNFNSDGRLAGRALWKQIAATDGVDVDHRDRISVFQQWERLDLEAILGLQYPRTIRYGILRTLGRY